MLDDVAATALRRAREHAEALGPESGSRIAWVRADLTTWTPPEGHFDLVAAHYVHPAAPHEELFRRLAASVAPGGTLLVVSHDPSDPHPGAHASSTVPFTVEEVAATLDPGEWEIETAESRSRSHTHPHGDEVTLHDAVLRARKQFTGEPRWAGAGTG